MTGEANEADKLAQQIGQMEGAGRVSTVVTRGAVTTCGCTLEPGSGKRTYCERHEPTKTGKGQALLALDDLEEELRRTPPRLMVYQALVRDVREKIGKIEELKKARAVRKG